MTLTLRIKNDLRKPREAFGPIKPILLRGDIRIKENDRFREPEYHEKKEPFSSGWGKKERHNYTITEEEINAHIKKGGWWGLPIPFGRVVVDVDHVRAYLLMSDILRQLELSYCELKTPNGGQFVFGVGAPVKNTAGILTWGGFTVDYRTDAGMIVLPLGESTEGREWVRIADRELDPMPIWLNPLCSIDALETDKVPVPLEEGSRDETLFKHFCRLQSKGVSDDDMYAVAEFMADNVAVPPFDAWQAKLKQALQYEKGQADTVTIASPANPMPNAKAFYAQYHKDRFIYHDGMWKSWNSCSWRVMEDTALEKQLYDWLSNKHYFNAAGEVRPFNPNNKSVKDVVKALQAETHVPQDVQSPAWFRVSELQPENILPVNNGLLDVSTGLLHPATPMFFNEFHIPFDYEPDEFMGPVRWVSFLKDVWGDDRESIHTLQELFGYLLTPDTSLQKIFLLIGPPRSGKGTISRILSALLGRENVAGPTLNGLSKEFGLQSLMGKLAAVISDARLSGKSDNQAIVERLLAISGEDSLSIPRKYLKDWYGRLRSRILIQSNELPRLMDSSTALVKRCIVLKMSKSFYGREDSRLTDKLLEELPAILNWALAGRERLYARGHFIQPESAAEELEELEGLSSPITKFIREKCALGPKNAVRVEHLYQAWCYWSDANHSYVGDAGTFGKNLRSAFPEIPKRRLGSGEDRIYVYAGIRLLEEQESVFP